MVAGSCGTHPIVRLHQVLWTKDHVVTVVTRRSIRPPLDYDHHHQILYLTHHHFRSSNESYAMLYYHTDLIYEYLHSSAFPLVLPHDVFARLDPFQISLRNA